MRKGQNEEILVERVQIFSYKIKKFWKSNLQHDYYSK